MNGPCQSADFTTQTIRNYFYKENAQFFEISVYKHYFWRRWDDKMNGEENDAAEGIKERDEVKLLKY